MPGKLDIVVLIPARLVLDSISLGPNSSGPNMEAIILLINVIFGTTVLGWIAALIWAMSAVHPSPTGNHGEESGLNVFDNDPQLLVLN